MSEVLTFRISEAMDEAERKAWEALSGYKFWMFGYHAAKYVQLAQLLDKAASEPIQSIGSGG